MQAISRGACFGFPLYIYPILSTPILGKWQSCPMRWMGLGHLYVHITLSAGPLDISTGRRRHLLKPCA